LNDHQARERLIGVAVNLVLLLREQLVRALPTLILALNSGTPAATLTASAFFTILNMDLVCSIFE